MGKSMKTFVDIFICLMLVAGVVCLCMSMFCECGSSNYYLPISTSLILVANVTLLGRIYMRRRQKDE